MKNTPKSFERKRKNKCLPTSPREIKLSALVIQNDDTLHLVLWLRGGARTKQVAQRECNNERPKYMDDVDGKTVYYDSD